MIIGKEVLLTGMLTGQVYERLIQMAIYFPVADQKDGSYLTITSNSGIEFMFVFFLSGLSQMFVSALQMNLKPSRPNIYYTPAPKMPVRQMLNAFNAKEPGRITKHAPQFSYYSYKGGIARFASFSMYWKSVTG